MKTLNQPQKRSIALRPLSREHHEALLFVWKIRQGIDRSIAPERIAKFCSWFWETHLQSHMAHEEAAFTKVLSRDNQLMYNMFEDHDAIKIKMEQLSDDPSYDLLRRLAEIIYYHVRFEERVLFPAIERTASIEQLSSLALDISDSQKSPEWPDAFWLIQAHATAA